MAIARINSVLVKHSRVLFGVITIIIIISFVWFFSPGTSGSIFFERSGSPNSVVGKILNEKITQRMVNDAHRELGLFQALHYGVAPSMIRGQSYQETLSFAMMVRLAAKLGISISDKQVGAFIRELPAFKGADGKFSAKKYEEYEKQKLNPENYTALDIDKCVRDYLMVNALSQTIGAPVATESEINAFAKALLEKYTVRTVTFKADTFTKKFVPAEKDLETYFKLKQNNKNTAYMADMRLQAEVVRFSYGTYTDRAQKAVSAAAVKNHYEANKNSFMKAGKVQPFNAVSKAIREKLVQQKATELAVADASALREKLYDVTSELSGDANEYVKAFRDVCKKNGYTAVATGWFNETAAGMNNIGSEPVLVKALSEAAKDRPITDPVTGKRAVYVAVVTAKQAARPATFKEAYPRVKKDYIAARGLKAATEAAAKLSAALAKSKNPAADLAKLATGAEIVKITPFSDFTYSYNIPMEVPQLAKETPKGKLSMQTSVQGGIMMVFVDDRTLPTSDEIKKARPMLEQQYRMYKQQAIASAFSRWLQLNSKNYTDER